MQSRIRQTINNATRMGNINNMRKKGADVLIELIGESLVNAQTFKFFLVKLFQEVVLEELAEMMHLKLSSLDRDKKETVIEEMANRYILFAELGYVFTFKNYLDRV